MAGKRMLNGKVGYLTILLKSLGGCCFLWLLCFSVARAQSPGWILPGYRMDFNAASPIVSGVTGNTAGTDQSGMNGVFDENNRLLFYVMGDQILDGNGTLVGSIQMASYELSICQVPGCCNRYYVFYYMPWMSFGSNIMELRYTTVQVNYNYSVQILQAGVVEGQRYSSTPIMAIGKLRTSGTRFLYVLATNPYAIRKFEIRDTGVVFDSELIDLNYGNSAQYSTELELSPDQTKLAMTRNDDSVIVINLDQNGNRVSTTRFRLTGAAWIHGLEFSPDGNDLFVSWEGTSSAGGVDVIHLAASPINSVHVPNSASLNYSMLEIGIDGNLYGLNDSGLVVIDMDSLVLTDTIQFNVINLATHSRNLPDQIDGETYTTCCRYSVAYQNREFHIPHTRSVSGYIVAGTNVTSGATGPVVVKESANVHFKADDYILLDSGFTTEPGALFLAEITPCSLDWMCGQGDPKQGKNQEKDWENYFARNVFGGQINGMQTSGRTRTRNSPSIEVYPNPFNNQLYLTRIDGEILEVRMFHVDGKILSGYSFRQTGPETYVLDVETLPEGMYLLQVITRNQASVFRVSKINY